MKRIYVIIFALALLSACATTEKKTTPQAKAPEGVFPPQIGQFKLEGNAPSTANEYGYLATRYSYQGDSNRFVDYNIKVFASPDEAKKAFDENKKLGEKLAEENPAEKFDNKVLEETETRRVIKHSSRASEYVNFNFVAGSLTVGFSTRTLADAINFANNLPYAAYGGSSLPPVTLKEEVTNVTTLLGDFDKTGADALKGKYADKILTGTVAAAIKDKNTGLPAIALKIPKGSAAQDMLAVVFKEGYEPRVLALKEGQEVKFRCYKFTNAAGFLFLETCTLQE